MAAKHLKSIAKSPEATPQAPLLAPVPMSRRYGVLPRRLAVRCPRRLSGLPDARCW